jgi:hypothetical protein
LFADTMTKPSCQLAFPSKTSVSIHDYGEVSDFDWVFNGFFEEF